MTDDLYNLSDKLLNNITQIERLYGQIEAMKVPRILELNLIKQNLVKSSYASNKIEGNPLTLPEVTNLLLDDRVPVNRDEKEVVNYFRILQNLEEYRTTALNLNLVRELHQRLMHGVDPSAGIIRNVKVVVGKMSNETGTMSLKVKHDPPFHTKVQIEKSLVEILDWASKNPDFPAVIKCGLFHHKFVYIHPFEDGNGRICRLLTALLFLKNGYHINRYFILDDYYDIDRQQYSDMLHEADTGNKSVWLEYFSDGVKFSLQSAIGRIKQAMLTLKIEDRPTKKQQEILNLMQEKPEITSQDVVNNMKISRQQAHALLSSLCDKNILEKRGITKNSYYVIKQ